MSLQVPDIEQYLDVVEAVEELSKEEDRSASKMTVILLREALKAREEKD